MLPAFEPLQIRIFNMSDKLSITPTKAKRRNYSQGTAITAIDFIPGKLIFFVKLLKYFGRKFISCCESKSFPIRLYHQLMNKKYKKAFILLPEKQTTLESIYRTLLVEYWCFKIYWTVLPFYPLHINKSSFIVMNWSFCAGSDLSGLGY